MYSFNWMKLHSLISFQFSLLQLFHNCLIPLIITVILFLGPITAEIVEMNVKKEETPRIIKLRNYLFSPLLEEYVFRFLLGSLLINCFTINQSILISSLLFALCHIHHYFSRSLESNSGDDLIASIFQIFHTFLYGCYASYFYFKCDSLLTPIILHAFCNFMTFPDFESLFANPLYKTATLLGLFGWFFLFSFYVYYS